MLSRRARRRHPRGAIPAVEGGCAGIAGAPVASARSWDIAPVRRLLAVVLVTTAACGSSDSGSGASSRPERSNATGAREPTSTGAPTAETSAPPDTAATPTTPPLTVTRVVDGDTVHTSDGRTIRLIGMDTPELVDPRTPVQCFAREASTRAHQLLDGATVSLEYDPTQGRTDRYGRTLAYLWRSDGLLYNLQMIADGYAHEYTYRIPYKHQELFRAAERDAREHDRGLWSPTTCNGDTTRPATTPTAGPGTPGCDASYPTVCIPPPPPDLDCAQITDRRFPVVGTDPHHFDADHDGIGCER